MIIVRQIRLIEKLDAYLLTMNNVKFKQGQKLKGYILHVLHTAVNFYKFLQKQTKNKEVTYLFN